MLVKNSSRAAHSVNRRLFIEQYEPKLPMAGDIGLLVQHHLAGETVAVGAQDAVMAQLTAYTTGGKQAKLDALYFAARPGTNFRGIEDFDLRADLVGRNGRPGTDGIYETVVARDVRPQANTVRFFAGLNVNLRGVPLQVTADIRENATAPQKIGLGDAIGKMTQQVPLPWWYGGRSLQLPIYVHTVGADNPVHKVEQSARLMTRELAGPTADTAVPNEKGIVLGRFSAAPSGTDPLLLTSVVYTASQGNVYNISQWQLWVDTDNSGSVDTIVQDNASTLGSTQVNFQNLLGGGYVVTTDTLFEVRGNVASSLTSHTLQVGLAGLSVESLENGATADWQIDHTPQTVFAFMEESLHVSLDTTPVPQQQVLGGTQSDTLGSFTAAAKFGPVNIYYVGIDVEGEGRSIDRIRVLRDGVVIGTATRGDAELGDDFGVHLAPSQLVVAEGRRARFTLDAFIKRDTEGGVSGDRFALAVDQIMARGDISSNDIDVTIDDILSPVHTVVMSKITGVRNANPDADGSSVPTGVTGFGQFAVSAAPHSNTNNGLNKVVLASLMFDVDATNVTIDATSFRFYNKADATSQTAVYRLERMDGSVITDAVVTGKFRITFPDLPNSVVNSAIESGNTQTFVLQGLVVNSQVIPTMGSSLSAAMLLKKGQIWWIDQEIAGLGLGGPVFDAVDLSYTLVNSTRYRN